MIYNGSLFFTNIKIVNSEIHGKVVNSVLQIITK